MNPGSAILLEAGCEILKCTIKARSEALYLPVTTIEVGVGIKQVHKRQRMDRKTRIQDLTPGNPRGQKEISRSPEPAKGINNPPSVVLENNSEAMKCPS